MEKQNSKVEKYRKYYSILLYIWSLILLIILIFSIKIGLILLIISLAFLLFYLVYVYFNNIKALILINKRKWWGRLKQFNNYFENCPLLAKLLILFLLTVITPVVSLYFSIFFTIIILFLLFVIIAWIVKKPIEALIVVLMFFVIFISVNELSKNSIIINISPIPKAFQKQNSGYTNRFFENHIKNNINFIRDTIKNTETITSPKTRNKEQYNTSILQEYGKIGIITSSTTSDLQIEIHGVGISINNIIQYLKRNSFLNILFKNKYYKINGDIAYSDKCEKWIFYIRINEKENKEEINYLYRSNWEGEETFVNTAEIIFKYIDPSNIMTYYFLTNKYCKLTNICKEFITSKKNLADAHYYLGLINLLKNDNENAINEFKLAILRNFYQSAYHYWLGVAYANMGNKKSSM